MDSDSKDLVKIGADAVVKPFGDLLTKPLGGPCEQIDGIWEDSLIAIRQERQRKRIEKTLWKTKRAIDNAGFLPKAVPDYILIPALHAAALEDDEMLQDMWASLIANAANPESQTKILPVFTSILKELAPNDAVFLSNFYDAPDEHPAWDGGHGGYYEVQLVPFHPLGNVTYYCLCSRRSFANRKRQLRYLKLTR